MLCMGAYYLLSVFHDCFYYYLILPYNTFYASYYETLFIKQHVIHITYNTFLFFPSNIIHLNTIIIAEIRNKYK